MTASEPPAKVEVGQIWADKNQWHHGRTCRVVRIDGRHVVLVVVTEATNKPKHLRSTVGRTSSVLFDERGVRGYRLISEGEGTPNAEAGRH